MKYLNKTITKTGKENLQSIATYTLVGVLCGFFAGVGAERWENRRQEPETPVISADVNGVEMTYQPTSLEQHLRNQDELLASEEVLTPPAD